MKTIGIFLGNQWIPSLNFTEEYEMSHCHSADVESVRILSSQSDLHIHLTSPGEVLYTVECRYNAVQYCKLLHKYLTAELWGVFCEYL